MKFYTNKLLYTMKPKYNKETACLLLCFTLLDVEPSLHTCWASVLTLSFTPGLHMNILFLYKILLD